MLTMIEKKYSRVLFVFLSLLLVILAGCDTTSDPKVFYQPAGSWQGTVGTDQVRGIFAPDGSFHLAIVDATGAFVPGAGEYIGGGDLFLGQENIGNMSFLRLQTGHAMIQTPVTFKLTADRLFSSGSLPIELSRTPEANGPALLGDIAGHWSLTANDNLTAVVVATDGTLSGGDGVSCQYSGSFQLLSSDWSIYRLDLVVADYTFQSCLLNKGTFSGLAMRRAGGRDRLWFAANTRGVDGTKTFFADWARTVNSPPVAKVKIHGERADHSVLVQHGASVEFDARGSLDANHDQLSYLWSGTDPDGNALNMTTLPGTGEGVATFIPVKPGVHTLRLTVSDGIESVVLENQQVRVEWTDFRYIACNNGTVLDTVSNLLWLRDAGCADINLNTESHWGYSATTAPGRVGTLLQNGVCTLSDGSSPGDWRLPTKSEFSRIVLLTPSLNSPPALLNGRGDARWQEGDVFYRVGKTNLSDLNSYIYWTADPDPVAVNDWIYVDFNYNNPLDWSGSDFSGVRYSLWPVRALRTDEQCPTVP